MVSIHRVGSRRPGRPLLGTEPLSERLTVMVTPSMLSKIEARSGGHVAEFVRRVLGGALGGGRKGRKSRTKYGRKTARIRRYGK